MFCRRNSFDIEYLKLMNPQLAFFPSVPGFIMSFLKVPLIPLALPPSHAELCSAGTYYVSNCAESKRVMDRMSFLSQITWFLHGMASRPEILFRNTTEPE